MQTTDRDSVTITRAMRVLGDAAGATEVARESTRATVRAAATRWYARQRIQAVSVAAPSVAQVRAAVERVRAAVERVRAAALAA